MVLELWHLWNFCPNECMQSDTQPCGAHRLALPEGSLTAWLLPAQAEC